MVTACYTIGAETSLVRVARLNPAERAAMAQWIVQKNRGTAAAAAAVIADRLVDVLFTTRRLAVADASAFCSLLGVDDDRILAARGAGLAALADLSTVLFDAHRSSGSIDVRTSETPRSPSSPKSPFATSPRVLVAH